MMESSSRHSPPPPPASDTPIPSAHQAHQRADRSRRPSATSATTLRPLINRRRVGRRGTLLTGLQQPSNDDDDDEDDAAETAEGGDDHRHHPHHHQVASGGGGGGGLWHQHPSHHHRQQQQQFHHQLRRPPSQHHLQQHHHHHHHHERRPLQETAERRRHATAAAAATRTPSTLLVNAWTRGRRLRNCASGSRETVAYWRLAVVCGLAALLLVLPSIVHGASDTLSSSSSSSTADSSNGDSGGGAGATNSTPYGNFTDGIMGTNHTLPVKDPLFPADLFTLEQRRSGAIVFHVLGVMYMFVALAIVCDEFFVPSLDVIIEKLGITDDVAGATFMAAGGSAPELFTSVIGVFVSFDDVGIGTIVGSAVFNILFVIGMCALFSKTLLTLTWWPLFRDCTFYSISLCTLIYFFRDNKIYWWEALILFSIYVFYAVFMKWNQTVERFIKRLLFKNKVTRVRSTDQLMPAGNAANSSETSMATQPGGSVTSRAASESRSAAPGSSGGGGGAGGGHGGGGSAGCSGAGTSGTAPAKFRHGLLQLMIHTIDPLHDGRVDEKATQLHAIASLRVLLDATKPQRGAATTSAANHVNINLRETKLADSGHEDTHDVHDQGHNGIDTTLDSSHIVEDDSAAPLSMAWPETCRKRITYVLVAPILVPLWLTLPDTRAPRSRKWFPITFIGSICWIAAYSYLMVWWANMIGETANIPPEVMGLTFLAAGTSIPDLITSVIVARKGFGDMAVSSSVGSNIFDVTVGLPIPWLLYGLIYDAPVEVNSVGMVCSIAILFMMLLFVVISIACFSWKMNKGLGFTMFLLYFVFVAVSLAFEYDFLVCPV